MSLNRPRWPILSLLTAATIALPSVAAAQPKPPAANPAAQATLLGQFGDWGAYTASPGGHKVCFALSKPTASQDNPPNRRTAANIVYLFVSTRPDEKVKHEISMLVTGYTFKSNTEAAVNVGSANFAMYAQNDGAWVKTRRRRCSSLTPCARARKDTCERAVAPGTRHFKDDQR